MALSRIIYPRGPRVLVVAGLTLPRCEPKYGCMHAAIPSHPKGSESTSSQSLGNGKSQ